jgi:uncharacterized membrane protein YhaH (DUF805 family)
MQLGAGMSIGGASKPTFEHDSSMDVLLDVPLEISVEIGRFKIVVRDVLDLGTGSIVLIIFALGVIIPGLAVSVRRLHDIGRSGWWLLISLLPIIGFIVLIVFYVTKSDGPNEYGQGPDVPAAA